MSFSYLKNIVYVNRLSWPLGARSNAGKHCSALFLNSHSDLRDHPVCLKILMFRRSRPSYGVACDARLNDLDSASCLKMSEVYWDDFAGQENPSPIARDCDV